MKPQADLACQWWRLNNLYSIRPKKGPMIAFKCNKEQEEYYFSRHTCNHIGKARQLGFSTFHKILALDAMLFPSGDSVLPPSPDGIAVGHIDFTLPDGKKKLRIVKEAYLKMSDKKLHPDTWQLGKAIQKAIPMKASLESITFGNGSTIWVGTALRGSTPQILDISELGKIAYYFAPKAEEIRSGALNTIAPGNIVNIESTHEGGEAGLHYDLLEICMNADPNQLTEIDFKFHFFPWYECTDYELHYPDIPIRPEIETYFERLSAKLGRTFTHAKKLWYDRTQKKQRHAMKKEFPSTPGEMFEAINQYAIYGTEMADLVAANPPRILDFGCEGLPPIYTFWDIGLSDYTAIWLIQPVGRFYLVLDWLELEGKNAAYCAEQMRGWETKWKKNIAGHYLPHDANTRSPGTGTSYYDELKAAGLHNLRVVNRIPDKWLGIGFVRDVLPHCYFHKTNCDTPREVEGQKKPSGVACLKGYHKEIGAANKTIREMPAHDQFSHSCDAFRTFAEAHRLGIINPQAQAHEKPKAVGGVKKPMARR